jgi:hypothetical protein
MTRDWRESLIGQSCPGTPGPIAGCTKKPESYPLTSFRVDYQTWNCQQLADEAGLLKDALAVASEQRAGDTAAHLRAETEAVHTARTLKKCNA